MKNHLHKIFLLAAGLLLNLSLTAAAVDRPNILLIFSDDHAKKALSCYGNTDIQTPGLDRIAAEGMRFEHALTPNSFCTPARAAVLTGKYSHKNGVTHLNQEFDGSQQTFPRLLQAAGYETSLFGKWHLLSRPTGFDHFCVMKMQGMPVDPIVFEPQHEWVPWSPKAKQEYLQGGRKLTGYNNDVITDEALTWLKNRDGGKPFCMLLHPKPPHAPYHPPKNYEEFLKDVQIPEPPTLLDDHKGRTPEAIRDVMTANRLVLGPSFQKHRKELEEENPDITEDELTRAIYQEYIKGYYRLVKSVDDNVARVLEYLDESGLADNTLVIYSSDQGFSLGEHGFYNKQWMYENPLHQPLLVRYPGVIDAGTVHESMVNHVDLAPTLLDFAGLPIPDDMQGYSLKPILQGQAEKVRDASYYHFYNHGQRLPEMIGVRTATQKLIHYPGMPEAYQWEMFDLENDPEEMNNLYGKPERADTVDGLKTALRGLIADLDDPVEAPALIGESPANSAAASALKEQRKQGGKAKRRAAKQARAKNALVASGETAENARPAQRNKKKAERQAPTYADVAYDVHERTKLDFWQAEGEGPRPLHVFIHGGGWIQGDKSKLNDVASFLEKGISVAAINYRYSGTDPLPTPVHDAVRAIQFLRFKADEWNIDRNRFVLSGGSAGGCTSLLIACLDDLADPDSDDPVARESSRVQGAAVRGAQTAIDPKLIEPWIGTNVLHEMIYRAVGEESIEAALANYEKHEALYKQFSAYNHVSPDDPPLYLGYGANMALPATSHGHGIHHGMFGVKLKEKSQAVGHNRVHLAIKGTDETEAYRSGDDFISGILLAK